jgi:hypothetical protein
MCKRRTTCAGDLPGLCDLVHRRIVEDLALPDRRPRLRRDPVRPAVGVDVRIVEVRLEFDLVHGGDGVGFGGEALEMVDLEVRHADRARAAVCLELLQGLPRRHEVAAIEHRERPMDQEEIDIVRAELHQRLRERLARLVRLVEAVVEFARDEDVARSVPDARTASPTPCSLPYISAVSMCRYPVSSATETACSVSFGGIWKTPKPSCGIARPSFSSIVGTPPGRAVTPMSST